MDLEKEIEWEWVHREKQEIDLIECAEMDKEEFVRFARYFYNLALADVREECERRMHICDNIYARDENIYYHGKAEAYKESAFFIDNLTK